jgi:hypothetical protein
MPRPSAGRLHRRISGVGVSAPQRATARPGPRGDVALGLPRRLCRVSAPYNLGGTAAETRIDLEGGMGHCLRALVLTEGAAQAAATDLPQVVLIPLAQGLSLVPVTNELFDAISPAYGGDPDPPGPWFERLCGATSKWCAGLSFAGSVAYIETEYFGGTGDQGAAVWDAGGLVYGPSRAPRDVINQALRMLGVSRDRGRDEFDSIGLGRWRGNDDWVKHGRD